MVAVCNEYEHDIVTEKELLRFARAVHRKRVAATALILTRIGSKRQGRSVRISSTPVTGCCNCRC
jgi:hypothetical protein